MGANGNIINLTGKRFGALTVLHRAPSIRRKSDGHRQAAWVCRCDCGEQVTVRGRFLRVGGKKACGIRGHRFSSNEVSTTIEERRCYNAMLQRCYNPNVSNYKNYGGRGIKVCKHWREDFTNFLSDMGPRPSLGHSLDRWPNRDGDYKPGNCRWATDKEQALNRNNTVCVVFEGKTIAISEYAEKIGLSSSMLRKRLARGWPLGQALTVPNLNAEAAKEKKKSVFDRLADKIPLDTP